jgi:hypothetical protein|tara:strand:- start:295 stop:594 length:300 start_codon:yes stop_codon:yes gene_type:complete
MFIDAFRDCNREENFTYYGRVAMFEYFTELEDDIGEQIEFDPIGICCAYTQYESLAEIQENYDSVKDLDDLRDHTQVIEVKKLNSKMQYVDGGLIIEDF